MRWGADAGVVPVPATKRAAALRARRGVQRPDASHAKWPAASHEKSPSVFQTLF